MRRAPRHELHWPCQLRHAAVYNRVARSETTLQHPQTLIEGKYEIIAKIREGGMGTIYKVRHRLLDEVRVIKVMKPQVVADHDLKRRFVEEAKTATRLKHPNICTIHDFALDEDGTAYLVMEFIDGVNLSELMHLRGTPELPLTLEITHQTLLALGYLHRRNVVHRDIAPDNLMMTHDEEGRPRIKLIDLGIAKALDQRGGEMTSTGVFLGKLKYASPEQYGALSPGEKIDGRSDLYCLGVVLYELLTGARPFLGESPAELLRAHLFAPPVPFEEVDPRGAVPADVRAVVLKALEKKREDRFPTAEAFDREIVTLMGRFGDASDLPHTVQLLSAIRRGPAASDRAETITPSAQDRLDRHFGPHTTPHPSRSDIVSLPRTVAAGGAREPSAAPPAAESEGRAAPRPRRPTLALVAAAAVVLAAVLLWPRRHPAAASAKPAPSRAAVPTPATVPLPTAEARRPEPAPAAGAPALAAETAKETQLEPTAPAAAPTADDRRPRRDAESARGRAAAARAAADRARAAELASALYEFGRRKQTEGQQSLGRKEYAAAQSEFDAAGSAFAQAETWSRAHPPATPERVAAAPTARPEPPVRAAAPPTALPVPAEPTARPAPMRPVESARPGVSEQDRIREVLHEYERAQSTLDPDLYARVYPSVDREKIRANFQSLHSQTLAFDIRKIEIAPGGASAVVRGHENRTAVPHIGSEQRFSGERVIHLEKRGDSWVIVSLS